METDVRTAYAEPERENGETIASQIRSSLADAITSGRMAPGTEIDEQEIAQRFKASRTPVREALRELASSGLVIIEPRRGVRVVEMTMNRIGEMFEVMAEIEAVCVRMATHRMTTLERLALNRLHVDSYPLVQAGDVDRYDALNKRFHAQIYQATHNTFLSEHAAALRVRLGPFRRAQFRGNRRLVLSFEEHSRILESIFSGDGEAAAKSMRAHIMLASAVYVSYAQDQLASSDTAL
ncbi:MAG TPA: GntR family transcriptional regulator [Acidocella sp.]|nr:GntR family transcriptional regulator [Acidocella sp.]